MPGTKFQGATGQFYEFAPIQLPAVPYFGGVFIFAKTSTRGSEIIYVGEADSIYDHLDAP